MEEIWKLITTGNNPILIALAVFMFWDKIKAFFVKPQSGPTPAPVPLPVPSPSPAPAPVVDERPIIDAIVKLLPTIIPIVLPLITKAVKDAEAPKESGK